jgi:alkanesulfonate monooxygenase SsuD/methylene tetrahydromethanopterin reductase-like flavin-dependent oxidoreductase (luciferase family)
MRPLEIGLLLRDEDARGEALGTPPGPPARARAIVERAVRAEQLGFDSIWLDGGARGSGVLQAAPVLLAAIAARTTRLRLGAGVALCAGLDALRIAEDLATLDGLSSGRVELVVSDRGFAGSSDGSPAGDDESRDRLRETVELLRRLWSEADVSWSGRTRGPLERVTVQPRPVQQPHPPLWIGSGGDPHGAALAAALGLPVMLPGGSAPSPAARIGVCSSVRFGPPSPQPEGATVRGSAEQMIEQLRNERAALGIDVQLVCFDPTGHADESATEGLERFARDVLPALRQA